MLLNNMKHTKILSNLVLNSEITKLSQFFKLNEVFLTQTRCFVSKNENLKTISSINATKELSTADGLLENEDKKIEKRISVNLSKLDKSFENAQIAFKSKSTMQLLRGWLVFQLCGVNFLVDNQHTVCN